MEAPGPGDRGDKENSGSERGDAGAGSGSGTCSGNGTANTVKADKASLYCTTIGKNNSNTSTKSAAPHGSDKPDHHQMAREAKRARNSGDLISQAAARPAHTRDPDAPYDVLHTNKKNIAEGLWHAATVRLCVCVCVYLCVCVCVLVCLYAGLSSCS